MLVYVIVNDVNLKIYVGKTITSNLTKYLQSKVSDALGRRQQGHSHLLSAIRKHGREHFHIFPLFEGKSNEEICTQEILFIKALKAQHPDIGYNLCDGGQGNRSTPTQETRAKLSALAKTNSAFIAARQVYILSQKGIARPSHVVEALRKANLGNHLSEETKQKLRVARLAQPDPRLGTHHSEETKKRISEIKKGKPGPNLGRHWSEATRKAISETKRRRTAEKHLSRPL